LFIFESAVKKTIQFQEKGQISNNEKEHSMNSQKILTFPQFTAFFFMEQSVHLDDFIKKSRFSFFFPEKNTNQIHSWMKNFLKSLFLQKESAFFTNFAYTSKFIE
jgi:hypothetical protein